MMSKGRAAGLPIDAADLPAPVTSAPEPKPSSSLPLKIRFISAVDRCHYRVVPMDDWTNPPATCPKETAADEPTAAEVGAGGIGVLTGDARLRFLAMWETALDLAKANDFTLDPIRDPLMTLLEGRVQLVTDAQKLLDARKAVARLVEGTIARRARARVSRVERVLPQRGTLQDAARLPADELTTGAARQRTR